ncbi:hypothetical protein GDO81_006476 [Engystomops pustulosus]|uniref:Uncharacterized protein n=1 Tax=Engystomops pustulosus TaxID=76066 RepID=A0AAV7CXF1_ENGPU|nr:hypothetical protein GDO81_006476 [Engystomops pustulosus]
MGDGILPLHSLEIFLIHTGSCPKISCLSRGSGQLLGFFLVGADFPVTACTCGTASTNGTSVSIVKVLTTSAFSTRCYFCDCWYL